MGTLGFLTEHPAERAFKLLDELLTGSVTIQQRDRLAVKVEDGPDAAEFLVLKELQTRTAVKTIVDEWIEKVFQAVAGEYTIWGSFCSKRVGPPGIVGRRVTGSQ